MKPKLFRRKPSVFFSRPSVDTSLLYKCTRPKFKKFYLYSVSAHPPDYCWRRPRPRSQAALGGGSPMAIISKIAVQSLPRLRGRARLIVFCFSFRSSLRRGIRFFAPAFFICTPSCFSGAPATALKEKNFSRRREDSRWARPAFFPFKIYQAGLALVGNAR